ncbi:beta-ketoacyl-[acyl-carrier-protein] synthase family protein [Pullulanibacillus sp. KACC 23026]|uniref:beta-ketoacyl-[acyl-carrier-protein] synthase family protein n=1 Tax=Pullulanibacillus sp. KACC 23026 TaxID=3028315 RepID=UPI0023B206F1|nr:beta-ketoacyl-[acyl-carrier-protein] synthase family protein [Pullulanibacillus sp. KACC 23026]WEG10991.1 beta-ketoacyl-[acyl-carrier-protein] synthase family protein [Pullulanibacillus sp. KACC 23026]
MANQPRIVVTGLGAVTPFGIGVETFWEKIISGHSAVGKNADEALSQWAPVVAQVPNFDPSKYLDSKLVKLTDRFAQMSLIAVKEALEDANLSDASVLKDYYSTDRIGVSIGSAYGGIITLEEASTRLATGQSRKVSPRLVPKSIPNAAAATIAKEYDLHGPVMTYSTACASSSNAIGEASYWLQLGKADLVLVGGAESLFTPVILAGLRSSQALATNGPDDFSTWSRPFDQNRQGMVMGEGAAILVLETLDHAKARGAKIYAELVGYGTTNDAYHETSPNPSGKSASLAMQNALKSAQLSTEEIGYINAHATATPAGDRAESAALKETFGEALDHIPVSSIKGAIGHLLGSAGAIESLACIKAMETSTLPPTLHCENKEESAPHDIIPDVGRAQKVETSLSNSFGFGGQNSVLIWKTL